MDQKVNDYLTKQLLIERNVVTFRSLSRQFNIHVNLAKTILATYYETSKSTGPCAATYLVTGEVPYTPWKAASDAAQMEVDDDVAVEEDDEADSDVSLTKVVLVGETELPNAESQFTRIFAKHVYSLSPSPLLDAGLICTPSDDVYKIDSSMSHAESVLLGTITGPHVQVGKPVRIASSSKNSIQQTVAKEKKPTEEPPKPKEHTPEVKAGGSKPKQSGTLDWFKAKPKAEEAKSVKDKAVKPKPKPNAEPEQPKPKVDEVTSSTEEDQRPKPKVVEVPPTTKKDQEEGTAGRGLNVDGSMKIGPPKRGTKRKSAIAPVVNSDEDEAPAVPSTTKLAYSSKAKSKRAIVDSDDDDQHLRAPQRKPKAISPSLLAMMDVDDDEVIRASNSQTEEPPTTEGDISLTEDVEMEEMEEEPVKMKTKRKVKKIIPKGSNGRPKKRIVQSQTKVDDKGYMITEDVSTYETDDDDSSDTKTEVKAKAESKKPAKSSSNAESTKPKKSSAAGKKSGNIMSFFAKQK